MNRPSPVYLSVPPPHGPMRMRMSPSIRAQDDLMGRKKGDGFNPYSNQNRIRST